MIAVSISEPWTFCNCAFQFLYESALTFFQMKKTSRERWLRRRTRNGMVTPTKYITAPDARPVGFLQLVTWVVPCLVPTTSLFITSHMPIAESQPKLPNPKLPMENSKTAGLMIRNEKTQMSPQLTMVAWWVDLNWSLSIFILHPGCVRYSQKGGVSAADKSQTGHQSYGCLRLQIVAQITFM